MTVIFSSTKKDILYSVVSKNIDKFTKIENILYDEYPECKDAQNCFN